jgi:hypothetical protein
VVGSNKQWRTRARYTDDRPGTGPTPSARSRDTIVRGPHPGFARRIATILASTTGLI